MLTLRHNRLTLTQEREREGRRNKIEQLKTAALPNLEGSKQVPYRNYSINHVVSKVDRDNKWPMPIGRVDK